MFAAVQIASYCFPRLSVLDAFDRYLRLSFPSQIRQVIRFLLVFSEDVLHVVVNSPHGIRHAIFPPRLLSHRAVTVDPLGNVTVPAHVYSGTFTA